MFAILNEGFCPWFSLRSLLLFLHVFLLLPFCLILHLLESSWLIIAHKLHKLVLTLLFALIMIFLYLSTSVCCCFLCLLSKLLSEGRNVPLILRRIPSFLLNTCCRREQLCLWIVCLVLSIVESRMMWLADWISILWDTLWFFNLLQISLLLKLIFGVFLHYSPLLLLAALNGLIF